MQIRKLVFLLRQKKRGIITLNMWVILSCRDPAEAVVINTVRQSGQKDGEINRRCSVQWVCFDLCFIKNPCVSALWSVQVDLMKNISNIPQPFLYTRHVHFLNFTR